MNNKLKPDLMKKEKSMSYVDELCAIGGKDEMTPI